LNWYRYSYKHKQFTDAKIKNEVATPLVASLRNENPPTRFLKMKHDDKWVDIGDVKAIQKVRKALKEYKEKKQKIAESSIFGEKDKDGCGFISTSTD